MNFLSFPYFPGFLNSLFFYFLLSILALIFTVKATIFHRLQRAVFPKSYVQTIFIRVPCNVYLKYNLFFSPKTHSLTMKIYSLKPKHSPSDFFFSLKLKNYWQEVYEPHCNVSIQTSELFQPAYYMPDAVKTKI